MKRLPLPARVAVGFLVLMLVGVIINVGLAWSCAFAIGNHHLEGTTLSMDGGRITIEHYHGFGNERIDLFVNRHSSETDPTWQMLAPFPEWLPAWSTVRSKQPSDLVEDNVVQVVQSVCGWPFLALRSDVEHGFDNVETSATSRTLAHEGIVIDEVQSTTLATHILWPGFALNTLIFGLGMYILFVAPFQLRRTLRRMQGLCPNCAYPMSIMGATCTECGAELPKRK